MNVVRNLTLTCYGKQSAILNFRPIWQARAIILKFVIILKRCYGKQRCNFEFF
jgi:hypothetical protein